MKLAYDPGERHREVEREVIQKKIGGDLRKYYRFRFDRSQGGMITADCAGCGLACRFCWAPSESVLQGRAPGDFLRAEEAAERTLKLMRDNRVRQGRLGGGEPTLGRSHLFKFLNVLQHKGVRLILETNGILIGEEETYAQELSLYPFAHVRLSFKGCSEEEFVRLTGADRRGFHLQLAALRNLKKAGVSVHPAVMISFSEREAMDQLYSAIWKIDPRLHSEIEREEVVLYPRVLEKLERANLEPRSAQMPERRADRPPQGEKGKRERPRIKERKPNRGESSESAAGRGAGEGTAGRPCAAPGESRRLSRGPAWRKRKGGPAE